MGSRAVAVLAALILAPFGAQGADLVVWWDEGYYAQEDEAVREIIAAFEQGSGKRVDLVCIQWTSFPTGLWRHSSRAGRPTSPSADFLATTSGSGPSKIV